MVDKPPEVHLSLGKKTGCGQDRKPGMFFTGDKAQVTCPQCIK